MANIERQGRQGQDLDVDHRTLAPPGQVFESHIRTEPHSAFQVLNRLMFCLIKFTSALAS